MKTCRHLSLIRAVLCASVVATATVHSTFGKDGVDPIAVELTGSRIIIEKNGSEKLVPADRAKPGDVIQYEAVYRNRSAAAVGQVNATMPIPAGLELLPGTATPKAAQASLDGATFSEIPLKRRVTQPDGSSTDEAVPLSEYRALRWTFPKMAAGERFTVTARARVATVSAK